MGFFNRHSSDPSASTADTGISEFWRWWQAEGSQQVLTSLPAPATQRAIETHLHAINDGLDLGVSPATDTLQQLVVTADGDPELRAVARRWLLAAPESDWTWSYFDFRQPDPDPGSLQFQLAGTPLVCKDIQVSVRRVGTRIDVFAHHPSFAGNDEQLCRALVFKALGRVLGEQDLDTWIGEVGTSTEPVIDGFPITFVKSVVRDLAADFVDAQGKPSWIQLEGETPLGPVTVLAQVPLAAAQHPLWDTCITLQFESNETDAADSLSAVCDETLDSDGSVVVRQSMAGAGVVYAYVDGLSDAAQRLSSAVKTWRGGKVRTSVERDPGWSAVQHLRG